MIKSILLSIFVLLSSGLPYANENELLLDALVAAKATGMCGAIKQLSAFQESTKMPGGDEFILRFLNTEAARLGRTLPEFLTLCQTAASTYTTLMSSLEAE
jgi:hypothetical protein